MNDFDLLQSPGELTRWIRNARPPRDRVDASKPHGFFLEREPAADGRIVTSAAILLVNRECPWTCLMCDLWKQTVTYTVAPGDIPRQIEYALTEIKARPEQVKLYNSGSFFDPAAIPVEDYVSIARKILFAGNTIVECHPRLVNEKALRFRDLLTGTLEVGMGLETIHPEALSWLNKRFTLDQFCEAAGFLRRQGIQVRAFVLVKPPFLDEGAAVEWAVKSARFAFDCGVGAVSLIPTRGGNGALEALSRAGKFAPPSLGTLEASFERCLNLRAGRVFADTWELKRFSSCDACFEARRQRLDQMNLAQQVVPPISCPRCSL